MYKRQLVRLGHGEDAGGLEALDRLLAGEEVTDKQRIRLFYARATLMEAQQRFDEAFEAYLTANARQAAIAGMNIEAKLRGARAVVNDMTPEIIRRCSGRG